MRYIPFILFAIVIVGMLTVAKRNRRRQASAEVERAERIGVGSEVMTTSGLHGTVVAKNDDDTVQLSIAPGVEVRWELAALRDAVSLPARYVRDDDRDDDRVRDSVDIERELGREIDRDIRRDIHRDTHRDIHRDSVDFDKSDKRSGADPTG